MPIDQSEVDATISGWLAGGLTADQIGASVATIGRLAAIAEIRTHVPARPQGFTAETITGTLTAMAQLALLPLPLNPGEAVSNYIDALKIAMTNENGLSTEDLDTLWALASMAIGAFILASGRGPELIALLPS